MTTDELKTIYERAKAIIRAERKMRLWVFRDQPDKLAAKVAEIDELLRIVVQLKDAAKAGCETEFEQPRLLDVPRKAEYR